ncbi:fibritin protein [Salmonella phage ST44]|nr:fibritin protein [Salmonella phage ST65]WJJ59963.1 fibritin protein [Salmonella phage ST44]
MAICANEKGVLVGRMTRLFLAEGCGDAVPKAEDWKYLGSTTSKGVDYSPQTTTSEADTAGGFVSTLVTSSDMTISAEVEIRKNDPSDEFGFHRLVEIYTTELKARRQPSLWVRQVTGATIVTAYCNITSISYEGGTNDIVTGSLEFKVYDSDSVTVESLEPLKFTTDLNSTATTSDTLTVVVEGGVSPYKYAWRKDGAVLSDKSKATLENPTTGVYTVTVTDSSTDPEIIISKACTVT